MSARSVLRFALPVLVASLLATSTVTRAQVDPARPDPAPWTAEMAEMLAAGQWEEAASLAREQRPDGTPPSAAAFAERGQPVLDALSETGGEVSEIAATIETPIFGSVFCRVHVFDSDSEIGVLYALIVAMRVGGRWTFDQGALQYRTPGDMIVSVPSLCPSFGGWRPAVQTTVPELPAWLDELSVDFAALRFDTFFDDLLRRVPEAPGADAVRDSIRTLKGDLVSSFAASGQGELTRHEPVIVRPTPDIACVVYPMETGGDTLGYLLLILMRTSEEWTMQQYQTTFEAPLQALEEVTAMCPSAMNAFGGSGT